MEYYSSGNGLCAVFFFGIGFTLMIITIRLFTTTGLGTLAPWSPPKHLVVKGVYRYTRNPMIIGVFCLVTGECFVLGTSGMIIYLVIVIILNCIYIPLSEERVLEKRFGDEYRMYKKNVPRWIPRIHPWNKPNSET